MNEALRSTQEELETPDDELAAPTQEPANVNALLPSLLSFDIGPSTEQTAAASPRRSGETKDQEAAAEATDRREDAVRCRVARTPLPGADGDCPDAIPSTGAVS